MSKNFAYSTVLTAPSPAASGTSVVVQSGDGAKFPTEAFMATIWPAGQQPLTTTAEVVLVSSISTDTFTIVRAQEGSSARTVVVGDQIAATSTIGVWRAWTPTYTNLTVGNGTHQSFYTQIGNTVIARLGFTFGTTSTMGTTPTFSFPVTSVSTYTDGEWIGAVRAVAGGAGYPSYIQWHTTTTGYLLTPNATGTYISDGSANWTALIPGTWTTGNTFFGTFTYEVA